MEVLYMTDTIIKREHMLCICCMEEHDVLTVETIDKNIFKGVEVNYKATYNYCDKADEYFETEEQLTANDIAMKNEYRKNNNLLTSAEICNIRAKYGISQSDLCLLLGWGAKTITRYESHQVQDNAHDTILKKINNDPDWFITLLNENKDKLSDASYKKYLETATNLFEESQDAYLRKSIIAGYAKQSTESCGNTELNLDKVIDVICYFANSDRVKNLFKVKLMKMLWYADSLSYKRRGFSMMGLVYCAKAMGAVPIAHDSIMKLKGISYEEIEFAESTGYKLVKNDNIQYATLSDEDKAILNDVINNFGEMTKDQIVEKMHKEAAYIETAPHDIIQYKYANDLSIS